MSGITEYAEPDYEPEMLKQVLVNDNESGALASTELLERADDLLDGRFRYETHACRLTTLSAVIREEGIESIDLLKVDVQRAEMDVLAGVEPGDWPKVKQVVMEFHDRKGTETEGRSIQIRNHFADLGYEVDVEQDLTFVGTDRYNLYAKRPERQLEETSDLPTLGAQVSDSAVLKAEDVQSHLLKELPESVVPRRVVFIDRLPQTSSGKVDRKALIVQERESAARKRIVVPRNAIERKIAHIWQDVLGVDGVGVDDNFFELGGDSLSLIRVQNRLRSICGQAPPLAKLFELTTVAMVSEALEVLR